ncbi:unnamed protein product [Triticum turgidum subsp. durum]|uniref:DJ-1/PfpI domain-containing protein n=1 Tax=Triticum turgidum subsp. durum TaxID=4567 RepID=A0A9R1A421_TRITD|nr:unnamed protein product [Triticum turgidum subsp. durum]
MLSASKPLLALTSLTAMAIRLPPHTPTHYAPPHRRTPPFRSITRAALSPSTTAMAVSLPPSPKKVLVPIAMGTEEMEAVILAGVLRRAGADVTLASVEDGLEVEASYGTRIIADKSIAACADQVFDLVALPGGMPGSVRLRDNEILQRIMVRQAEEKRLYRAICAAPAVVLMPWGLHKGRKITCHPSFIGDLPTFRAVESNVQIDAGLERSTEVNRVEWPFDHKPQVLIPIANGSEEMEIIMLVAILRRANINVVLASVDESTNIVGSQRMKIVADKCILGASDSKYDLIIIPGGPEGAELLHRSTALKKLLKEQKQASMMYGGICYSPLILQKQGLLQDKTVTAHPSIVNQLTCQVIERSKVVIDGNLITGKGLGTVMDFSLAIVRKFFGHGRAKGVANGMVFDYPKS